MNRFGETEGHGHGSTDRVACPCCRYPTLCSKASYEICKLCGWEDDGQDDARADEVRGGPNKDLSLTAARANFARYLTKFAPERDPRIAPDSDGERAAKRALMAAFDRLAGGEREEEAFEDIRRQEQVLRDERERKLRAHSRWAPF